MTSRTGITTPNSLKCLYVLLLNLSFAACLGCEGDGEASSANTPLTAVPAQTRKQTLNQGALRFVEREANIIANFGTLRHHFSFQNGGQQLVRISQVRTSCTCAVAVATKDSIAPGETGIIALEIDQGDRPAPASTIEIIVMYKDPTSRVAKLLVHVHAKPRLEVYPPMIAIATCDGEMSTATAQVIGYGLRFQIEGIDSPPDLHVEAAYREKGGYRGWRHSVAISANGETFEPGATQRTVVIATDAEGFKHVTIPVTITKLNRISVSPELTLVPVSTDSTEHAWPTRVIVRDRKGTPVVINSIRCSSSHVDWRLEQSSEEQLSFSVIQLRAINANILCEELPLYLWIRTDTPCIQELTVRLLPLLR